jgi:hypothetical protein
VLLISHRGNLTGTNPNQENCPDYIMDVISAGFNVEIDVWYHNGFYLGHDAPTYSIDMGFLMQPVLWCHAKNLAALTEMLKNNIHCFWHQNDDVILTSKKYIWTYPGKEIASENAIAVLPERVENWDISMAFGICSDYIADYKVSCL